MEDTQKFDINTLDSYPDVRNIMYKLLVEQIMQPSIFDQLGYDLANCMFDMSYDQLQQKHRDNFDRFIYKMLSNSSKLSILTSELLQSEEELMVYRSKYQLLKNQFDKLTQKPDWIPNVTELQVSDSTSSQYTNQYILRRMYYSEEFGCWLVEVEDLQKKGSKCLFSHTQMSKI